MSSKMSNQSKVDVVIPTYHPDEKFEELLRKLGKQSYPVHHIYVIDTRSDHFPEEVEQMPGVTVHRILPEEFDHGATRDLGLSMSDADVVVFMTQDAVPANARLIEALVRPLEEYEKVSVSYARQLPARDCDFIERYTRTFNYPGESRIKGKEDLAELGIKTYFCSDVCAAYRRKVYLELGGFTKKTIFNEDMIMAAQMVQHGYSVAYAADAQVIHSHNYSGIQQFHRNFDLAVSQVDHPEVFEGIRSESEGIRLVKQTALHLIKSKKPYLIPCLVYKSGCKYLGYKLGQKYKKLPLWLVRFCSMSTTYWENP